MCSVRFGLCSAPWECSVRVRFGVRVHVCVRCLCSVFVFMFVVQFYEHLQILPLGNVRRIRKNDVLFLKMCVFREKSLNLCVFRENMLNLCVVSRKNIECVCFSLKFIEFMCFSSTFCEFVRFSWKFSELFGKSTNSTLGKRASFSQNSQT